MHSRTTIGVFDSGVGGLSVLDALRHRLPRAALCYLGDVAYAPYGERSDDAITSRCDRIVHHLVERGARIVVVACNTATVLTIATLRARFPDIAFVGVEPGVKPAAAQSRARRIAVMATPATSRSARLRHLIDAHAAGVQTHVEPCPGLADAIERGFVDGPELRALLQPHVDRVRASGADTVVLGCTHYPFAAELLQSMLGPAVTLLDTAAAVATRVAAVCGDPGAGDARLDVASTGATEAMRMLLARCRHLEDVTVETLSI